MPYLVRSRVNQVTGINGLEEKDYNAVIEKTKALGDVARDLMCSTAQLALAWSLRNEHVSTVITGASRVQQVTENLQALNVVHKLTPAVLERCVTACYLLFLNLAKTMWFMQFSISDVAD